MVQAIAAFNDVRIVSEGGSPGVKVNTATQRLLGTLTAPMGGGVLHRPLEQRGSLFQPRRTVIVGEDLPLTFEGDLLTDQICYLFQMGVKNVTPGGGIWQYMPVPGGVSSPPIVSYTLQFGNNLAVYDIEYVTAREIVLSGMMNEVCKVRATMFGRNFEVGAFDPAQGNTGIDPATTEVCLCNKARLYIDASGGTWGGTEKAATLVAFTWTLDTGFRPVKFGSANNFFDSIFQTYPKVTCEITAAFNTAMEAERVFYQAGTRRAFGIKIGATGSDYVHLFWTGVYTSWEPLGEEDGLTIVKFTIESEYDTAHASLIELLVANSLSSLP